MQSKVINYNAKPAKKTGDSKANTKGVWVEAGTFYPSSKGAVNAIYFDSFLELKVYRHLLNAFGVGGVERQKDIHVCTDLETGKNLSWKADFYLPTLKIAVEVKGQWINNASCKSEKTLFIWQYIAAKAVAKQDVILVSDKPFLISHIPVLDYLEAFPPMG